MSGLERVHRIIENRYRNGIAERAQVFRDPANLPPLERVDEITSEIKDLSVKAQSAQDMGARHQKEWEEAGIEPVSDREMFLDIVLHGDPAILQSLFTDPLLVAKVREIPEDIRRSWIMESQTEVRTQTTPTPEPEEISYSFKGARLAEPITGVFTGPFAPPAFPIGPRSIESDPTDEPKITRIPRMRRIFDAIFEREFTQDGAEGRVVLTYPLFEDAIAEVYSDKIQGTPAARSNILSRRVNSTKNNVGNILESLDQPAARVRKSQATEIWEDYGQDPWIMSLSLEERRAVAFREPGYEAILETSVYPRTIVDPNMPLSEVPKAPEVDPSDPEQLPDLIEMNGRQARIMIRTLLYKDDESNWKATTDHEIVEQVYAGEYQQVLPEYKDAYVERQMKRINEEIDLIVEEYDIALKHIDRGLPVRGHLLNRYHHIQEDPYLKWLTPDELGKCMHREMSFDEVKQIRAERERGNNPGGSGNPGSEGHEDQRSKRAGGQFLNTIRTSLAFKPNTDYEVVHEDFGDIVDLVLEERRVNNHISEENRAAFNRRNQNNVVTAVERVIAKLKGTDAADTKNLETRTAIEELKQDPLIQAMSEDQLLIFMTRQPGWQDVLAEAKEVVAAKKAEGGSPDPNSELSEAEKAKQKRDFMIKVGRATLVIDDNAMLPQALDFDDIVDSVLKDERIAQNIPDSQKDEFNGQNWERVATEAGNIVGKVINPEEEGVDPKLKDFVAEVRSMPIIKALIEKGRAQDIYKIAYRDPGYDQVISEITAEIQKAQENQEEEKLAANGNGTESLPSKALRELEGRRDKKIRERLDRCIDQVLSAGLPTEVGPAAFTSVFTKSYTTTQNTAVRKGWIPFKPTQSNSGKFMIDLVGQVTLLYLANHDGSHLTDKHRAAVQIIVGQQLEKRGIEVQKPQNNSNGSTR